MKTRGKSAILLVAMLGTTVVGTTVAGGPALAAPRVAHFANCDAMHRVYPHGVGKPGARDHTSGTPVTSFTRSLALYNANSSSDRDHDGIACEQA